jgi:hypothetical protein
MLLYAIVLNRGEPKHTAGAIKNGKLPITSLIWQYHKYIAKLLEQFMSVNDGHEYRAV